MLTSGVYLNGSFVTKDHVLHALYDSRFHPLQKTPLNHQWGSTDKLMDTAPDSRAHTLMMMTTSLPKLCVDPLSH